MGSSILQQMLENTGKDWNKLEHRGKMGQGDAHLLYVIAN